MTDDQGAIVSRADIERSCETPTVPISAFAG